MSNERYRRVPLLPTDTESTHLDLKVEGTIPPELEGLYVRNGPNALGTIPPHMHYFSGQGMVHGVRISDGRALWYRSRVVRAGRAPELLGEEDPGGPIANGIDASPNTNLAIFGGRLFATVEGGANPVELTDGLDTVRRSDFDGALQYGFTGHHKICPETQEAHGVVYSPALPGEALYVRISPEGERLHSIKLPLTGATQIHDMAITSRYAIVLDLNVVFDPAMAEKTTLPITWTDAKPSRVGVVPKDGTSDDVRWFDVDPCYVYHPMNAYDAEDGSVVLDVSRYERAAKNDIFGPLGDTLPTIDRWVLPMEGTETRAKQSRVSELALDFPKVSPLVQGLPYRYGYTVTATLTPSFEHAVKLDVTTGKAEAQMLDGGMASELTFIPRAGGTDEDDGWLIGYCYQPEQNRSRLVILNGQDFAGDPAASIWIPQPHVPIGTHGDWFPGFGYGG
ncbi:MAG: carotenoid oxygenase family protein [Myxococcota bacterium]